jgi:hypothetical protein
MRVQCIVGFRTEQLYRVLWNRDIWSTDTVIQVGTNYLKRTVNVDCVMGEMN